MEIQGTVKLGDKERFDKEQIGVKEPTISRNLLHKDKEQVLDTQYSFFIVSSGGILISNMSWRYNFITL